MAVVISQANGNTPAVGGLFNGLSFFLLQRVPSRTSYVEKVQANGGRVVKLEAQAVHVIADHLKTGCPPGSVSYTFIDAAIRDGELPDPADHVAGPPIGAVREVGSISVPGKQTRTAFTAEDDRVLWQWVERAKSEGGLVKGNDIYKQLEAKNPRHTFQSWRDRYMKKLMDKPPAGVEVKVAANAPPSPPDAPDQEEEVVAGSSTTGKEPAKDQEAQAVEAIAPIDDEEDQEDEPSDPERTEFGQADFDSLMANAEDVVIVDEERQEEAWEAWASAFPGHTAAEWQVYWEEEVLPAYKEQRRAERRKKRASREESADEPSAKRKGKKRVKDEPGLDSAPDASARDGSVEGDVSASQKRKRDTSTPKSASKHGRKKHKNDFSDLFRLDEEVDRPLAPLKRRPPPRPVNPTDPIEILSTDGEGERDAQARPLRASAAERTAKQHVPERELPSWEDDDAPMSGDDEAGDEQSLENVPPDADDMMQVGVAEASDVLASNADHATQRQPKRDLENSGHDGLQRPSSQPHDSGLPTSEAKRAADQQVRRESGNESHDTVQRQPQELRYPDLPTSDANRAAEQQIRREYVDNFPVGDEFDDGPTGVAVTDHCVNCDGVEHSLQAQDATDPKGEGAVNVVDPENEGPGQLTMLEELFEQDPVGESSPGQAAVDQNDLTTRLDPTHDEHSQTLQRDRESQAGAVEIVEDPNDVTISFHLVEDGEVEDGLPEVEILDADEGGDALTEANFASQQAEHQAPLLRGVDLPEDDKAQDHTSYASYLQALLSKQSKPRALAAASNGEAVPAPARDDAYLEQAPAPSSDPLIDQTEYTQYDGRRLPSGEQTAPELAAPTFSSQQDDTFDQTAYTHNETNLFSETPRQITTGVADLPLSSQQDIDDVFEDSPQWSYSPQQSKRQKRVADESQSMQFETQIPYPKLPFQGEERDVDMITMQNSQPEIAYPSLPVQAVESDADDELEVQAQIGVELQQTERESSYVMVEQEDALQVDDMDDANDDASFEEEYELDLEVPEPEGGFGFSSSPLRSAAPHFSGQAEEGTTLIFEADIDDVDAELEGADELDLDAPEPGGGFGFSSSPIKTPASQPSQRIAKQSSPAVESLQHAEEEAEEVLAANTAGGEDVIQISSAESSSSPYQSPAVPSSQVAGNYTAKITQLETQDILDAETQQADLDMPLPPDSDDDSSPSDGERPGEASATERQNSVDVEAQHPKLDLPPPEDSDNVPDGSPSDPIRAPPPPVTRPLPKVTQASSPRPSQPLRPFKRTLSKRRQAAAPAKPINLSETQTLEDDDLMQYITTMELRLNISEVSIINALKATSMQPELAELVLLEQKADRGLPRDIPGVWSVDEDAIVEGGNAKKMKHLGEKHGWDECFKRMEFLDAWRNV